MSRRSWLVCGAVVLLAAGGRTAEAQFTAGEMPLSGATHPTFDALDDSLTAYMAENQISAGVFTIIANGRAVYERGIGWKDYEAGDLRPVLEDDILRVASVTKPIVASAVQQLIAQNVITANTPVFEYAAAGGILPAGTYYPYNGVLGDPRYADLTVGDLLMHQGGFDIHRNSSPWNGAVYDPQFSAIRIANELDPVNPTLPPGPVNTVQFMLSQPLQYAPGTSSGLSGSGLVWEIGTPWDAVTGDEPWEVATGDFNEDDRIDAVVTNSAGNTMTVLFGSGNGKIGSVANYVTGVDPRGVAVDDLDDDGHLDIALVNFDSASNNFSVFLGNGNGTFQPRQDYSTGVGPSDLVLRDVNKDSILDITVAAYRGHHVWIHMGNGDGTFQAGVKYPVGTNPRSVDVRELNNDQATDIVTANQGSDDVSVLFNNGDGTFGTATQYAAGAEPYGLELKFVDGDEFRDAVVTNHTAATVSVLLGTGTGLLAPTTYAVGDRPRGLTVKDADDDGIEDIVTANRDDGNITILRGNGDGSFGTRTDLAVGTQPQGVVVADLNRDGREEILVTNWGDDDLSIIPKVPALDSAYSYSNFGFMLLGLILDQVTGTDHLAYIHGMMADWGGAPREVIHGRTFRDDQDPREPYYDAGSGWANVFCNPVPGDCSICACVEGPYGGWEQEVFIGHGDLVANALQVARYADNFLMFTDYSGGQQIGTPLGSVRQAHTGSLPGTSSLAANGLDNADNPRYAIIVNNRASDADGNEPAVGMSTIIVDFLNANAGTLPTTYATDNWVDFFLGSGGTGTFASPKGNLPDVLAIAQARGRVKMKPGNTSWTGTISAPVRLDAPLGSVRIGQQ